MAATIINLNTRKPVSTEMKAAVAVSTIVVLTGALTALLNYAEKKGELGTTFGAANHPLNEIVRTQRKKGKVFPGAKHLAVTEMVEMPFPEGKPLAPLKLVEKS